MNKQMKIGIIGTGSISALHLIALKKASDKVTLTAACDIREDAVRRFAKQAEIESVYTDVGKMLKEADIEAVDICVSHQWHRDVAIAAAQAGKHVLLEKPMANSIQDCQDIISETSKAGVTFMVAQQLRYHPNYVAVKRLIEARELGEVWGLRSDSWLPVMLSRTVQPKRFAQTPDSLWRLDGKQAGGGSLIWNGTHFIDLFRYFIGDVKSVYAKCWTDHPMFTNGAEDRVMATLVFKTGAVGHLSNSWSTRTPWQFQFMLLGTEGSVYTPVKPNASSLEQHEAPAVISSPKHDVTTPGTGINVTTPFVPIKIPEDIFSDNPYANEIAHFADCCLSGKEPISSGRDNLGTMKTIFGIYESSRQGRIIELDTL